MSPKSDHMEIEVKFHIGEPDLIRRRLLDAGRVEHPRTFEINSRFDDSSNSLFKEGKLLRLRRDSACRLTFKSKPEKAIAQYKAYRELEVGIEDFDTMNAILKEIGYQPVQIYEKWRETFALAGATVCLDTMPFGNFMEIEGDPKAIREAAAQLGLVWDQRILHNYLAMFAVLKARENLPFNDVTFDNFTKYPADIIAYLPEFYPNAV